MQIEAGFVGYMDRVHNHQGWGWWCRTMRFPVMQAILSLSLRLCLERIISIFVIIVGAESCNQLKTIFLGRDGTGLATIPSADRLAYFAVAKSRNTKPTLHNLIICPIKRYLSGRVTATGHVLARLIAWLSLILTVTEGSFSATVTPKQR